MAADQLKPNVLSDIAAQIAERIHYSPMLAAPGSRPGLGESLKLVMLPLDSVQSGEGALAERVVDTGQWHHQVYSGPRAVNFARSVPLSDTPGARHEVVEVAESMLPEALKTSIKWVDANMPNVTDAKVLVAPAYFLTGLWLRGDGDDAVVISSMAEGVQNLELNQRIDADDFLRRLAQNEAVEGAGLAPEQYGDGPQLGASA